MLLCFDGRIRFCGAGASDPHDRLIYRDTVSDMTGGLKRWLLGWLLVALTVGVCSAQYFEGIPKAPTPAEPAMPGSARVAQLVGDVSVLRGSEPWVLNVGDTVRPKQVIVTGPDSWAVFDLEDGSTFQVFPNSRVTFRANQGDWRDLLDLWLGRVKVYIQHIGSQPNRNRVFTPTAVISVRGTVFDVVIEDDEDTTLVSVEEGLVDVRHRLVGETKSRSIAAGEYIRVYKNIPIAKQAVDKNALMERMLRASVDALYTIMIQNPPGTGGAGPTTTGGGPTLPGDTGGQSEPAPPADSGGSGGSTTPAPPAPPAPPPGG